ncbi:MULTISPECIES: alpha/beta fold hydrolase [Actinoalloteichus]|uniref:Lysophospholipase n=1 Tax=Actinoalloteichus fjordicus TaxID=1612552 RepID=A0AAC9PU28_9PSEU|nr:MULTISPECIES: alpha/beta hydrolase [Actinoalloteichus]APU16687.1 lysophospholipase [Actinoalloteichus fjordicus]APU22753.1 lysophospholipase [Actinoalloteichus sp. GBA129-24]
MVSSSDVQYLERPGQGRLAFDVHGSGPLVLLVPGMGELRSTYRFLVPVLVDAGYTVATCDLRGHGESDASFAGYGDVDTAGDVEALLRELGSPAVIVGNSMAAGAAVIVAAEHPELVRGLVLVGPFVRDPAAGFVKKLLFRVLMARPWAVAAWKAFLPTLYTGAKPADFADYRAQVIASMKRPAHRRAFSITTRTDHAAAASSLARVTAPSLVVMGERDPDFPSPEAEADWIARELRGTAAVIPDAGHYPHAQQPAHTADVVIPFLAGLDSRA